MGKVSPLRSGRIKPWMDGKDEKRKVVLFVDKTIPDEFVRLADLPRGVRVFGKLPRVWKLLRSEPRMFYKELKRIDEVTVSTMMLWVRRNVALMAWARGVMEGKRLVVTTGVIYDDGLDSRLSAQIAVCGPCMSTPVVSSEGELVGNHVVIPLFHHCEGTDRWGRLCRSEHALSSLYGYTFVKFNELSTEAQELTCVLMGCQARVYGKVAEAKDSAPLPE